MPTQIRRLPLFVALAALVLYACTVGGGLTLTGLPLAAKLAGWNNVPLVGQPLLWLLTLPLRVLPAAWLAPFLKLFAATLAALILGLVTRTVQLLPWDHQWDKTNRLACLLPGLTAAAVCGLEFSFWREATSSVGDLLDLLLLAAAVWLLLESQVRRNSRWLNAAAVVWGVGMAENWVMLLALPLFVAFLVRLRRRRFFRWRFILRMAGLGLAGFSVYAILPVANSLLPQSPWTWRQAWMISLHQTKSVVLLPHQIWRVSPYVVLAVAICFVLTTVPLLIRMRDKGTRNNKGKHNISRVDRSELWIYRGLRVGLLLACFWLAFDPAPGARQVLHHFGIGIPLLTFDYLNALASAFLLGNLLLISQKAVPTRRRRSRNKFSWRQLPVPIAAAALAVVALALAVRNLPAIWQMNHRPVEQLGDLAVASLPAGRGVVLSDFPEKLLVFQAALARGHRTADWLAVDTRALPTVQYRARLEQRWPAGWLTDQTRHELTLIETRRVLEQVARTNRLFYLHPSYGQFFERFYLEPSGLVYQMKLRGQHPLDRPLMDAAATEANEQFWTRLWDQDLAAIISPPARRSWWTAKLGRLGLAPVARDQDRLLRDWYSIALGSWGVALQRQGRLPAAQARFEQALQLNTNNLSARISLDCNTNLQAGNPLGLADLRQVASQSGKPALVEAVLNNGGPIDEPSACYLVGSVYFDHGFIVQAAEQMERIRTLIPGAPEPELKLVILYNLLGMPERSRPLVNHLREVSRQAPANNSLDLDLALQESYSWLLQTNLANARAALQAVVRQHPGDQQIASRVMLAYLAFRDFTNALQLVEERLAKVPDDVPALNDQAMVLMQSGQDAAALPVLDHVLTLTNQPAARISRAFARIATHDFARAKTELNELESSGAADGRVEFGLALVAGQGDDTNSARHYLQLCLSNTPAGGPLWQRASARLRQLNSAN